MRETVERLAAIEGRAACTDAERRAAGALRDALRARGREARTVVAWIRPQWAAAHALHCALAVAGSLVAVRYPEVAAAVLALTLASLALEASGRGTAARRLFSRRATQDVVSEDPREAPVRLVVTAPLDAGATGAILRPGWARLETRARRHARGRLTSPLGLLTAAVAVLLGLAIARLAGSEASWLNAAAVAPTVLLIIAFGAWVDIALSPPSPGANATASGVAVALELVRELDRRPPRNLAVDLVLAGAGETGEGLRRYVRDRRATLRAEEVAVLALGPCGIGTPRFDVTEGRLAPVRLHPALVAHARAVAADEAHLVASPTRRGLTGAHRARLGGWPALGVRCLDATDRPGLARTPEDTADAVEDEAMEAALELCLGVVARLDAELDRA